MGWRDTIQDIEPKDKVVKKGWRDTIQDVEETEDPVIETLKDVATTAPQGITTWADEAQAGVQAGYKSLVEGKPFQETYEQDVSDIRADIAKARERSPIATKVGEFGTSLATTLTPGLGTITGAGKLANLGPSLVISAFEGLGTAEDKLSMEGAVNAGWGTAFGVGGNVLSAGIKKATTMVPGKIRAMALGAGSPEMREVGIRAREDVANELKDMGLFQNMKVDFDVAKGKFIAKGKSLESVERATRPKYRERLFMATNKIQKAKESLLGAKAKDPVNMNRLMNDLDDTINEYADRGPGFKERYDKARGVVATIIEDLKEDMSKVGAKTPTVEVLEKAKARIKEKLGTYGKNPLLKDPDELERFYQDVNRNINKEMELAVGNPEYTRLNSMQQRMLTASHDLDKAIASDLISQKSNNFLTNASNYLMSGPESLEAQAFAADILNKPIVKLLKKPMGAVAEESQYMTMRYLDPSTNQNVGRSPQSVGISPRELIKYRIPRTTQGILENKDMVLAKIVQAGASDEMVDTITDALNGDAEDLANIAPLVMTQFPTLFEKSKYKTFDGKFLDPMDKSRAADEIAKRDDLDSLKRFKMINDINKHGKVPEE